MAGGRGEGGDGNNRSNVEHTGDISEPGSVVTGVSGLTGDTCTTTETNSSTGTEQSNPAVPGDERSKGGRKKNSLCVSKEWDNYEEFGYIEEQLRCEARMRRGNKKVDKLKASSALYPCLLSTKMEIQSWYMAAITQMREDQTLKSKNKKPAADIPTEISAEGIGEKEARRKEYYSSQWQAPITVRDKDGGNDASDREEDDAGREEDDAGSVDSSTPTNITAA